MIYTKTGDKGMTSLVGGERVSKADIRIEAYGTIDELNSFLGLLRCKMLDEKEKETISFVQNKLFSIGSYLATDQSKTSLRKASLLFDKEVVRIEKNIDKLEQSLPPLKKFVIPGGTESASLAHVCRSICRRAERCLYRMDTNQEIDYLVKQFINRLSDYLFLLGRNECLLARKNEIYWEVL